MHFYPRPPRGGRPGRSKRERRRWQFLSTPSARRATHHVQDGCQGVVISIHALREEGDSATIFAGVNDNGFLSTPSARRATLPAAADLAAVFNFYPRPPRGGRRLFPHLCAFCLPISIHALREEGDPTSAPFERCRTNFYPRPPRGGRPMRFLPFCYCFLFLSTPSARRATP